MSGGLISGAAEIEGSKRCNNDRYNGFMIYADYNTNYGGPLINQKYSPLSNITLVDQDKMFYWQMFADRLQSLTGAYPPQLLNFYGKLPNVTEAQTKIAPIVVASSNRADWMEGLLLTAQNREFPNGYLDNTTFYNGVVPWYAPGRSGGRQVYVVVHVSEYSYYNMKVGRFSNVKVFGYRFIPTKRNTLDIVGFGASRYAALQLMIHLGYHRAWLVDDNVININGFPQVLKDVEDNMRDAIYGIGFHAATTNQDTSSCLIRNNDYKFNDTGPGLLQQAVLWNIALMRGGNLNYCPVFVTSNEDVSLSNYLQKTNRDERIITAFSVIKYALQNDSNENIGAQVAVPKRRSQLVSTFSQIEKDIRIGHNEQDSRPLETFIREGLYNAGKDSSPSAVLVGQSQAIEQVMAKATMAGYLGNDPFLGNPPTIEILAPGALPSSI